MAAWLTVTTLVVIVYSIHSHNLEKVSFGRLDSGRHTIEYAPYTTKWWVKQIIFFLKFKFVLWFYFANETDTVTTDSCHFIRTQNRSSIRCWPCSALLQCYIIGAVQFLRDVKSTGHSLELSNQIEADHDAKWWMCIHEHHAFSWLRKNEIKDNTMRAVSIFGAQSTSGARA